METGYTKEGLYYQASGEGPPLLLIHAGVADSRMWRDQMGLDELRTIAFDQRGYGQTKWVPGPFAARTDAIAVMDQLGVESAVVVGCSSGASVALQMALTWPDRVDGLVLVGALAQGWEPKDGWTESELEAQAMAAFESGDIDTTVDLEARMWLAGEGRSLEDLDPALVSLFRDMDRIPLKTEAERGEHVEAFGTTVDDRLDEIRVPTLVVVGVHDEALLVESAWYLADRLSDRPPAIIENAAHLPSLERPGVFNHVLREYLATI